MTCVNRREHDEFEVKDLHGRVSGGSGQGGAGQGLSLEATAERLTVTKGKLSNWVMAAKRGTASGISAPRSRSVAELEAGVARLRK